MKKIIISLLLFPLCLFSFGQRMNVMEEIQANPQKAFGTDYPYTFDAPELSKAPKGYKPFYISHYARHGSRYYWSNSLYLELDTILTEAHDKHKLNATGESFYQEYKRLYPEFMAGMGELTKVGWDQHQAIARKMYESFPEVFRKGGHVSAISSLSGRCIISMGAFCQELVQCNPDLEIYEQSSRFTLHGVVPDDKENPYRKDYVREELEMDMSKLQPAQPGPSAADIVSRLFTSTDGLSRNVRSIESSLKNLYTSLPSIGHEGLMGDLYTPSEICNSWERSNIGAYRSFYRDQNRMKPVVADILDRAKAVIDGESDDIASFRFGHDTCLGPLTVLMGINIPKEGISDPNDVKYYFQNYQIGKAANLQFIFYRSKKNPEILIKCLQNGYEASLPLPTDNFPYYRWSDFYSYYSSLCAD